jgi:hypothetical protein
MLIIVNSMPKSGSTWFHNFIVRGLCRLGYPTPHEALANWPLTLNPRANPGALDGTNLRTLLAAAEAQTLAVKAHVPPNRELLAALAQGQARTIFLIRHPADIARSALAYGEFCRAAAWDEPYRDIYEPRHAADFIAPTIDWAIRWLADGAQGTVAHYEELFASDDATRATAHRLEPRLATVSAAVLDAMRPSGLPVDDRRWLRVNLVRRPELDATTLARCQGWARELGYPSASGFKAQA